MRTTQALPSLREWAARSPPACFLQAKTQQKLQLYPEYVSKNKNNYLFFLQAMHDAGDCSRGCPRTLYSCSDELLQSPSQHGKTSLGFPAAPTPRLLLTAAAGIVLYSTYKFIV